MIGWMTIVSRCGDLRVPIHSIELRDGRLIFEGTVMLTENYVTDEFSRAIVAGVDGIVYADFPFRHGSKRRGDVPLIDDVAGTIVTATLPTGIVSVKP